MYKQVLFAIDGGPASRAAIPVVAEYARASGAAVRVLHVVRLNGSQGGADSRELVKSFVEAFSEAGVTAGGQVHVIRRGSVADAIARAALDGEADLVAIASRGRSDLGALFLGSVSSHVASD
ncbi:MAG: universal stress protein, partial [Candidatus Dormibacteraeota bacterium]|nr:universal stress protein [Candidatus Dormibacteraeota bacterium]